MFEALAAVLCSGACLIAFLLAFSTAFVLLRRRKEGEELAKLEAVMTELGLRSPAHKVWAGQLSGRAVVLRPERRYAMDVAEVEPGMKGRWRLRILVACGYPGIGGECYVKRPWRSGRTFDESFSCLPPVATHLDDAVRSGLMGLVARYRGQGELLDRDRSSLARLGLGEAPMAIGLDLDLEGLDAETMRAAVAEMGSVAGALEARSP